MNLFEIGNCIHGVCLTKDCGGKPASFKVRKTATALARLEEILDNNHMSIAEFSFKVNNKNLHTIRVFETLKKYKIIWASGDEEKAFMCNKDLLLAKLHSVFALADQKFNSK